MVACLRMAPLYNLPRYKHHYSVVMMLCVRAVSVTRQSVFMLWKYIFAQMFLKEVTYKKETTTTKLCFLSPLTFIHK